MLVHVPAQVLFLLREWGRMELWVWPSESVTRERPWFFQIHIKTCSSVCNALPQGLVTSVRWPTITEGVMWLRTEVKACLRPTAARRDGWMVTDNNCKLSVALHSGKSLWHTLNLQNNLTLDFFWLSFSPLKPLASESQNYIKKNLITLSSWISDFSSWYCWCVLRVFCSDCGALLCPCQVSVSCRCRAAQ